MNVCSDLKDLTMHRYDADRAPVAAEWLNADEDERFEVVERYHRARHVDLPDMLGHVVLHTIVENQLAAGDGAAMRALRRLMADGLTRHESVHAIAAVNFNFLSKTVRGEQDWPSEDINLLVGKALDALTAEKWLSGKVNEE